MKEIREMTENNKESIYRLLKEGFCEIVISILKLRPKDKKAPTGLP